MRIGGPPEITPPLTLGPFTIGRAGINRVAEQADGHEPGERIGRRPFDIDFLPPFLCLYISHALITGTERLWQFALPLLLIQIYPKFLLPSSILLFFVLTGKILLIPPLAKWSQRFEKLTLIALATALLPILVCCSVSLVYSLHQKAQCGPCTCSPQPAHALIDAVPGLHHEGQLCSALPMARPTRGTRRRDIGAR